MYSLSSPAWSRLGTRSRDQTTPGQRQKPRTCRRPHEPTQGFVVGTALSCQACECTVTVGMVPCCAGGEAAQATHLGPDTRAERKGVRMPAVLLGCSDEPQQAIAVRRTHI